MNILKVITWCCVLLASGAGAIAAPVVAGHPGLAGQNLDTETAKSVLLGKKVMLGSTRAVIVIAKAGDAQDQLLQKLVGMNTTQFQNHWRRLFMTGGGTAPKIVETEADVAKAVAATPGAVAIVDEPNAGGLTLLAKP